MQSVRGATSSGVRMGVSVSYDCAMVSTEKGSATKGLGARCAVVVRTEEPPESGGRAGGAENEGEVVGRGVTGWLPGPNCRRRCEPWLRS